MAEIILKGRRIPLEYTVYEMKRIQEELGPFNQALRKVLGRKAEDEKDTSLFGGAEHLEAIGKMVTILGNAGLELAGEKPDLTEKQVLRLMRPAQIYDAVNACFECISQGNESEIPPDENDGPVDETLEEMNKKKGKAG